MIAIIDYDAGNLLSVQNAFRFIGEETKITSIREEILSADKVVLPGVGAFKDAMDKLDYYNLADVVREIVKRQIPLLGICLGLQLLFESSEESEDVKGLGIFHGKVLKIPSKDKLKVPHVGWNSLSLEKESRLYNGINNNSYVYFVHSYYLKAEDEDIVAAKTDYGTIIHASIEVGNTFACQFHPEKSGDTGLNILKNFAAIKKVI